MGAALDNFISVALIVLLVFTALAFGSVEPWALAVFELVITLLLALWAVKSVAEGQLVILLPQILWPLLVLLGFGFAQGVTFTGADGQPRSLSLDAEATRLTTLTFFFIIVAMLLFANFLMKRDRIEQLGHFLVYYGLIFSVFGLAQHFSWNGKFFWVVPPTVPLTAPFGSFVNHAHFAGYIEMLMPFPLAMLLLKTVRREAQLFYGFAAVVMGVATVVSLSRGGMISMVCGLAFTSLLSIRATRKKRSHSFEPDVSGKALVLKRLGAGALVLVVILGGILWVGIDPVLERLGKSTLAGTPGEGQQTLYTARGFIWADTLKLIAEHPWLGTGFGAYATAFAKYTERDSAYFPIEQAHNDYLQIWADTGVVGGVLALWFLIIVWRNFARGIKHPDPVLAALVLGAGGGIFALLVHSIFDFNLQLPSNSLMFLLLATIITVIGAPARSQKRIEQS